MSIQTFNPSDTIPPNLMYVTWVALGISLILGFFKYEQKADIAKHDYEFTAIEEQLEEMKNKDLGERSEKEIVSEENQSSMENRFQRIENSFNTLIEYKSAKMDIANWCHLLQKLFFIMAMISFIFYKIPTINKLPFTIQLLLVLVVIGIILSIERRLQSYSSKKLNL